MGYIGNSYAQQAVQPATDFFNGNGSTTAFTLTRPLQTVYTVEVVVNNVQQNPANAYSISGNTINFTAAPSTGTSNIYVNYNAITAQTSVQPGQGTVGNQQLSFITNIASGANSLTLQTGSPSTSALTINTSQFVGIGTTNPSVNLDVLGGDMGIRAFGTVRAKVNLQTTNRAGWQIEVNDAATGGNQPGGSLGFTESGVAGGRLVLAAGGNVGVGTTTPSAKLDVNGNVNISGSATISNGYVYNGNGTNQFRMAIFSLSIYGGNQYVHMKTDQKTNNSNMYRFEYSGYDYGSAQVLGGAWVGYLYSASDSTISNGTANWGNRAFANTMYRSSDGYLVLVADTASYYCSFTIHYQSGATGQFSPTITAYSQQTSTASAY